MCKNYYFSPLFYLKILPLGFIGGVTYLKPVAALPTNGQIRQGNIIFNQINNYQLEINQTTAQALIDWQSFQVTETETLTINQPNANARLLNFVQSKSSTNITGTFNHNGRIMIVDSQGILHHGGNSTNLATMFHNLSEFTDQDFFNRNSPPFNSTPKYDSHQKHSDHNIRDFSVINTFINQSSGSNYFVEARLEKILLNGEERLILDFDGDGLISVALEPERLEQIITADGLSLQDLLSSYPALDRGIIVQLSLEKAQELVTQTVNMTGFFQATTVQNINGEIVLGGENNMDNLSVATSEMIESLPAMAPPEKLKEERINLEVAEVKFSELSIAEKTQENKDHFDNIDKIYFSKELTNQEEAEQVYFLDYNDPQPPHTSTQIVWYNYE